MAQSSWYTEFQNRLNNYQRGQMAPAATGLPDFASVAGFDASKLEDLPHNPTGVGEHLMDWGGRALDLISRPGYAAGGFLNTLLKDAVDGTNGNPLEAAVQGFEGKTKDFFHPAQILDPYQEGESGVESAARFATDFLASIFGDPLTYIPGAQYAKGARLIGDATGLTKGLEFGKELLRPSLNVTHEAADAADGIKSVPEVSPTSVPAQAAPESLPPPPVQPEQVPLDGVPSGINSAVGTSPLASSDVPTVAADLKLAPYQPDEAAQNLIQHLLTGGKVNAVNGTDMAGRLFAAKSVRAGLTEALAGIKGRLYRNGEFDNPWKDVQAIKEATLKEPVKPTFPELKAPEPTVIAGGGDAKIKLQRNVIVRSLVNGAADSGDEAAMLALSKEKGNANKMFYASDTDKMVKNGKSISPYDIAKRYENDPEWLANFTKKNPQARVLFDRMGKEYFTAPGMYKKMLEGNFPLKDLEGVSIHKMDTLMPVEDYAQSRRAKWTQSQTIQPTKAEMAAYEAELAKRAEADAQYQKDFNAYKDEQLGLGSTVRQKPGRDERINWLSTNSSKLTESDIKSLDNMMRLGNEKGFLNKIDEIMAREGTLDLQAIEALDAAVKAGRVDPQIAKDFYKTFGAKNAGDAARRLKMIDKRIADLEGKGASLAPSQPNVNTSVPADVNPLPSPTIKPLEVKQIPLGTPLGDRQAKTIIGDVSEVPAETLSPEVANFIIGGLKSAMDKEFKTARSTHTFGRRSPGAKGDVPVPYTGSARYLEEYNIWSQLTHWKALNSLISKSVPKLNNEGKPFVGYQRGKYMYDRVMAAGKASDDVMRAYGIQPSVFPGGKGIPLSIYDILGSLPEDWVIKHVFNIGRRDATDLSMSTGRQVTLTQLFHIAEQATTNTPAELRDFAQATLREGLDFPVFGKDGQKVDSLVNSAAGYAEAKGKAAYDRAAKNARNKNKLPDNFNDWTPEDIASFHKQQYGTAERIFGETLDPLSSKEFVDKVRAAHERNAAQAGIQAGEFVKKAEYDSITKFINDVTAANTPSEVFQLVENARKGVPGIVKAGADIVPPPGAVEAVTESTNTAAHSNFGTEMALKSQKEFDKASNSSDLAAVSVKQDDAIDDFTGKMIDDGTVAMVDLGNPAVYRKIRQWDMASVAKAIAAYWPHLSEGKMRSVWLASNNSGTFIANHFARNLSNFQRRVGTIDDTARIFNAVKNDTLLTGADLQHAQEMKKILDMIFDTTGGNMGFMQRNGLQAQHVNSHLKHFGIDPKEFGLKGATPGEQFASWKNWPDLKDPLDHLSKYFQAVSRSYAEKSFGSSVSQRFGFDEFQPGMVKIKLTGGSRMAHLVDRNKWYPLEIAENMKAIDKTLFDIAQPPKNNAFARIFDSLTHKYKTALTIYRPGHHLRNMYGDVWLNYMDGVRSPKYYNQAHKVLATRKNYYDDPILDTRVSDLSYNPKSTAITMRSRGGTEAHLSYDDIYRLAVSEGILHDYATIEDLGMLAARQGELSQGRSITRPFNGALHEKMAGVSEYRDHYVRMAHLMGLLEKDKNNFRMLKPLKGEHPEATMRRSLELQFQDYSARIRKWHPDGSDLTLWEKRVMRRGVLFYSWIRKAVPLVIESMLTRPGRFLAFPKAMYNLAESNGIDLNGFTDPFPTDQMFPAWMGGMQGPEFGNNGTGYMGLRPGIPGMDILDTYFNSPGEGLQTAVAGTHPLFKVPFELAASKTAQGIPIKDTSQYVLGQVPFGNITNTTLGWLNGGDKPIGSTAPSNQVYDQNSSGWKDPAAIAWINFLTGAGLIDMSKPSYIKAAQFDSKYGRLGNG